MGMNEKGSGENPLISIVVPIYNAEDCLPRCVETLRRQTYKRLEIILVDDGSTDGTAALCDSLAGEDERIHVFHKQNGGTSTARNYGIQRAQGEYLGFVDSDDYVDEDMYERLLTAIERYGTKAAQIGRDELDPEGNALPDICVPPQEAGIISQKDFLRELLMHRGDCSFCTKLIRKDCFAGKGFPEGALNEDFRLLIEMLPQMGPLVSLPGYGYHVCYRLGSNTRKKDKDTFSRVYGDCVDNADMVLELVKKEYPDMIAVAFRFGVFQRLEYLLHIPIAQMEKGNRQYREIVRWLRGNFFHAVGNPYLTMKNKVYHMLFAIAPKGIRVAHRWIRLRADGR